MFKKLFFGFLFLGPIIGLLQVDLSRSWNERNDRSIGITPNPSKTPEALVQIYQAKDFKWKGAASVRTWIATKEYHSRYFIVYEIEGWKKYQGHSVVSIQKKLPDFTWFGQEPKLIYELKGDLAQRAIPQIDQLARHYPYQSQYESWFGPNDNTFVAHIIRHVEELHFAMPPNAVGKDYLVGEKFYDVTPTKTGYQVNFRGMVGILVSKEEGFEINLGGLVLGVNPSNKEIKLPGFGSIGFNDVKLK